MNISLYEITKAIQSIEEMDESEDLKEYLDSVNLTLKEKIDNILRFRKTTELTVEAIKSEEKRLSSLRKSYENRNKRLKEYLSYSFNKLEMDKYESSVGRILFRQSEVVNIIDISKIPKKFLLEKISISADKKAIKKALKDKIKLNGVELIKNKNIIIK